MSFSEKILLWYAKNKRPLPWRTTTDPYKIWLSEIILQQTRVAQGIPYYEKFIAHFPTVWDLANANEGDILKLWQGLGYYSRARNLHAAAKTIVHGHNGKFPGTYVQLIKLKGIGDYTASAISSICFNEPQPVVDGNVYRVLARYFGVYIPINGSKGAAYFKKLAGEVMDTANIRDYNQGIMEFGALQCTPKNPACTTCPLNTGCAALGDGSVGQLPVKLGETKVRDRYFNYLVPIVVKCNGDYGTVLRKREGKGIWENLFEFPLLESDHEIELASVHEQINKILGLKTVPEIYQYNTLPLVHKLSHQHLHTKFWIVKVKDGLTDIVLFSDIAKFPVPVLIADFINTFKNSYF